MGSQEIFVRNATAIVLTFLAMHVHSDEWFDGENLLIEPIDLERYDAYEKNESGWKSMMWQNKRSEGADTVTINIVAGDSSDLARFREIQDTPGRDACDNFESQVIDDSDRNGYKSLFWQTECDIQDTSIATIQLAIAGDSLYHLRKTWRGEVSGSEKDAWTARLAKASLCDTRSGENPCPEGYEIGLER